VKLKTTEKKMFAAHTAYTEGNKNTRADTGISLHAVGVKRALTPEETMERPAIGN
jgi:hypothetical protein